MVDLISNLDLNKFKDVKKNSVVYHVIYAYYCMCYTNVRNTVSNTISMNIAITPEIVEVSSILIVEHQLN